MLEKDTDVFEAGVHALPIKGNHSMRGIADDHAGIAVVVRTAFDVDQRQVLIVEKLCLQRLGHDEARGHPGKIALEERYYAGRVGF